MKVATTRWFALGVFLFVAAFAVSALLYRRSRSADFGAHAQAVEAIGRVRHLDRLRSQQVLEARFGLLNQYDPINATGNELESAERGLARRVGAVVGVDVSMQKALERLEGTLLAKRLAVEGFKGENSLLRNSTYYLPTAAGDLAGRFPAGSAPSPLTTATQHLAQTGLAYDLIGDDSARRAHVLALSEVRACESSVPALARPSFALLLAHGDVISREVPAVDARLAAVVGDDTSDALDTVQHEYEARFAAQVDASNEYRRILYAWSLALLVAIGLSGAQLRRLYLDLERRVVARTAQLNSTLAELWGEMKLASKIQSALVPVAPALGGCDTAARMNPTSQVGGDYYDVIKAGDCEWILIGDVSGHGVPAGLIMMMCHTAVRTVLRNDPNVGPARLLVLVNTVLTQAIRQLGEDKYMTMTALRRSPDGNIQFAGAHQDVHVYRTSTRKVEAIETRGLWLGIKQDIGGDLPEQQLRLGAGDVLVLHTDGVTEATDPAGALFDDHGLARVLARAGESSAAEILGALFSALDGFDVTDDATVIVVKQLAAHQAAVP